MRVLFHVRSRRGLGHAVRAGLIGEALRRRQPGAQVLLAVSHAVPDAIIGGAAQLEVGDRLTANLDSVSAFAPELVVFDTVIPDGWWRLVPNVEVAKLALVLRESRPEVLARLAGCAALSLIERILIPHERHEFDPGFAHAVHVGPIHRVMEPAALRRRFPERRPLVVTTAGGGGHRDLCERFIAMAIAADRELRAAGHDFDHLLVIGPRYASEVEAGTEIAMSRFEPQLPSVLAGADVVISRAGYNTVQEIGAAGVPAVLVPGNPGLDDQVGRARRLALQGRATIVDPGDVGGLIKAVFERLVPAVANGPARFRASNGMSADQGGGERCLSPGAYRAADALRALWRGHRGDRSRRRPGSPEPLRAPTDEQIIAAVRGVLVAEGTIEAQEAERLRCRREDRSALRSAGKLEWVQLLAGERPVTALYAKSVGRELGRRLLAAFGPGAPGSELPIARPLALLADSGTLLFEEVSGLRLDLAIRSAAGPPSPPRAALRAMELAGRAVAELHRVASAPLEPITITRLLADLRPDPRALPDILGEYAAHVADWLEAAPDPATRHTGVLCHRDLHPRQCFLTAGRVVLIDLDRAGLGHPAIDVANLATYLGFRMGTHGAPLIEAFRRGARCHGELFAAEAEHFYHVYTLLRLATKVVRLRLPAWRRRATALLETAISRTAHRPRHPLSSTPGVVAASADAATLAAPGDVTARARVLAGPGAS